MQSRETTKDGHDLELWLSSLSLAAGQAVA